MNVQGISSMKQHVRIGAGWSRSIHAKLPNRFQISVGRKRVKVTVQDFLKAIESFLAIFIVVESKKRSRKSVVYNRNIFPKSRYGTASCAPKQTTRIGYSLDKVSLAKDQVLRVYFYEEGGQRELVLTIDATDINRARTSL